MWGGGKGVKLSWNLKKMGSKLTVLHRRKKVRNAISFFCEKAWSIKDGFYVQKNPKQDVLYMWFIFPTSHSRIPFSLSVTELHCNQDQFLSN